jgi:hypothetical protein
VFAGAAAEENADAQTLFVRGHGDSRFLECSNASF